MVAPSPSHEPRRRRPSDPGAPVLLFDPGRPGCDAFVEFVAARDGGRFTFVPIGSAYGRQLAAGLPPDPGPVVLVEGERVSVRSGAVFGACRHLRRGWPLAALGLALPGRLTDGVLGRCLGGWAPRPARPHETGAERRRP